MMEKKYANLVKHADELTTMLISKGYIQEFKFFPSDMRANLNYGMHGLAKIWEMLEVKKIPHLSIISEPKHQIGRNFLTIKFAIDYDTDNGFRIAGIEILNINKFGESIDTKKIHPNNQSEIPTKTEAFDSVIKIGWLNNLKSKRNFKF